MTSLDPHHTEYILHQNILGDQTQLVPGCSKKPPISGTCIVANSNSPEDIGPTSGLHVKMNPRIF